MIALSIRTGFTAYAAGVAALGICLISAPTHADDVKFGGSSQPSTKTKGIEFPGVQSGGTKSAPFDPVTVTFPKTTKNGSQPAGGSAFHAGVGRRR